MSAGKLTLQANDGKALSLVAPEGMEANTTDVVATKTDLANQINSLAPYSGYTKVSKKLDNFVFQTSSSFINKVADKNRFVKFGDKVVDTYLHTSYDATKGGVVADFTNTVPDVAEIITNGSNTTSVAVSQGDYVVDGSELVTSISGTTTNSQPVSNNALVVGRSYIITGDCSGLTTGTYSISLGGSITEGINQYTVSSNGPFAKKLVLNNVPTQDIYVVVAGGFDGEVSNLSVRRVSDTFRAKQDAPIGTALTNTTYFEDRTQIGVTNQALSYHAYNTLTNAYEGIKTEVLFSDVSKEDLLDNSVWMARNGFSKVSQFLYSKGSYLVLPVGVVQC